MKRSLGHSASKCVVVNKSQKKEHTAISLLSDDDEACSIVAAPDGRTACTALTIDSGLWPAASNGPRVKLEENIKQEQTSLCSDVIDLVTSSDDESHDGLILAPRPLAVSPQGRRRRTSLHDKDEGDGVTQTDGVARMPRGTSHSDESDSSDDDLFWKKCASSSYETSKRSDHTSPNGPTKPPFRKASRLKMSHAKASRYDAGGLVPLGSGKNIRANRKRPFLQGKTTAHRQGHASDQVAPSRNNAAVASSSGRNASRAAHKSARIRPESDRFMARAKSSTTCARNLPDPGNKTDPVPIDVADLPRQTGTEVVIPSTKTCDGTGSVAVADPVVSEEVPTTSMVSSMGTSEETDPVAVAHSGVVVTEEMRTEATDSSVEAGNVIIVSAVSGELRNQTMGASMETDDDTDPSSVDIANISEECDTSGARSSINIGVDTGLVHIDIAGDENCDDTSPVAVDVVEGFVELETEADSSMTKACNDTDSLSVDGDSKQIQFKPIESSVDETDDTDPFLSDPPYELDLARHEDSRGRTLSRGSSEGAAVPDFPTFESTVVDSETVDENRELSPRQHTHRKNLEATDATHAALDGSRQSRRKTLRFAKQHPSEVAAKESSTRRTKCNQIAKVQRSPGTTQDANPDHVMELGYMSHVAHMTKYTTNKHGYPTKRFTVLNNNDESIYDFQVEIRESEIPNAGLGAFITFLRARKLTAKKAKVSNIKMRERHILVPKTMEPLVARGRFGFDVSVKVTGHNLHRNNNSVYVKDTCFPIEANYRGQKINVFCHGKHLHYDDSDDEETPLNFAPCWKIGLLENHQESDYFEDQTIQFSSEHHGCGTIELGRYGPVMKEDRKTKTQYDLKTFVFSNEPAEWGFDGPEKLFCQEQTIDITGDSTGKRHSTAMKHVPSYINECGHSKDLRAKQNVYACARERSVDYFFATSRPMVQGECRELLVNYTKVYEDVRERKGYGRKNIVDELRSDDHEPTRLQRNFRERASIVEMIESLETFDMYVALEFLVLEILSPISSLLDCLVKGTTLLDCTRPSPLQVVARRRLHWLSFHFRKRVRTLEQKTTKYEFAGLSTAALLSQCEQWTVEMHWDDFDIFAELVDSKKLDFINDINTSLDAELREELLFPLCETLQLPLDERRWCAMSQDLTRRLCSATRPVLSRLDSSTCAGLADEYLTISKKVVGNMRLALQSGTSEQLRFDSLFERPRVISGSCVGLLDGIESSSSAFWTQSNVSVPVVAAVGNARFKNEANPSDEFPVPKFAVMTKLPDYSSSDTSLRGIPRGIECLTDDGVVLHDDWYLIWQVVFVVHVFASHYLTEKDWSLAKLCSHVGVSKTLAETLVRAGLCDAYDVETFRKGKSHIRMRKRVRGGQKKHKAKAKRGGRGSSSRIESLVFERLIWKTLVEKLQWTRDNGTRPNDLYFLPPGVRRGRKHGFSNRIDYWDSTSLVLKVLETHPKWSANSVVKDVLHKRRQCIQLYQRLKTERKLPKGDLKMSWLLQQIETG